MNELTKFIGFAGYNGTFTKYPWCSTIQKLKIDGSLSYPCVKKNKFGYLDSDKTNFEQVAAVLGLPQYDFKGIKYWHRHPLSLLLEAADTICYRIIDVEDSYKLKMLTYEQAKGFLLSIWEKSPVETKDEGKLAKIKSPSDQLVYLRAKAINSLIFQAYNVWVKNYAVIMKGEYSDELMKEVHSFPELDQIEKALAVHSFSNAKVLKIELAGYKVLGGLLQEFCYAISDEAIAEEDKSAEKLRKLIPEQFIGAGGIKDPKMYDRLLKITDFVSRMTDSYAIEFYKHISGISLPDMD